ncbi:MAG: helix-turn-helix domain-containing protein, partial [Synergistota bacterium]|nr:helix-turn-helix domain-containing protein [Synergistota bacterium]
KVICATCVDLEKRISEGRFRDDLYYRISTLPLRLPPLRDRGSDVLELSEVFLATLASRMAKPPLVLGSEVEQVFLSYVWPGNVRELKNLLERIYILKEPSDTAIRLYDLPPEMLDDLPDKDGYPGPKAENVPLQEHLDTVERDLIRRALKKTGGNRTRAAGDLGMSRYALLRRMQRHGMDAEGKEPRNDS